MLSGWNDETSQPQQQQQQQPPPNIIQMKSPPPTSNNPPPLIANGPRPLMTRPNFATDRPPFMPQQFNNQMITNQPPPKAVSLFEFFYDPRQNMTRFHNFYFQELWVETKTNDGKLYYYKAATRETTWKRPEGPNIRVMTQPEFEEYSRQQINPIDRKNDMMPQQMMNPTQHPMPGHMPFMPFNAAVPPFAMAPPQFGVPPHQWASLQNYIDPKILAAAAQWTEHRAPDGRFYYYNAATQQSIWEKPPALKELDDARMSAMRMQQQKVETKQPNEVDIERERKRKEEQEKAKPQKPLDKSRPISSTAIAGTPWCVVWTGDSKVFFFCPSTKTSVWERPEDLKGRADVDKAVSTIPEQLKSEQSPIENDSEKLNKENQIKKFSQKEPQAQVQTPQQDNNPVGDEQMDIEKSEESNDDDEVQEIPIKKQKIEGERKYNQVFDFQ